MLLTVLVFFLILSVLVLVHEAGHFFVAKRLGIKVEEFGFGLPPRIFGLKFGETLYSINWLPIGGFVKLFGEEGKDDIGRADPKGKEVKKRAFYTLSPLQRSLVIVAGVVMNFVLAVSVISYLFTQGVMVPTDRIHIEKILAGSPAEKAGLKEKDIIRKMKTLKAESDKDTSGVARRDSPDGGGIRKNYTRMEETEIKTGEQLIETTKKHLGESITLMIDRNGQNMEISIIPRKEYPKD